MDSHDQESGGRRDELISGHLHFPRVIARQFAVTATRAVFLDDLIAAGNIGLVEAAERFDPRCGVKFSTFAWPRIRGAMVDGLRTGGRYRRDDVERHRASAAREPTCRPASVGPAEGPDDDLPSEEEAIDFRRQLSRLARALARLPGRERDVMQLHYFEGLTLSEIAARMGVHRSWCTRLHQHALLLLQNELVPAAAALQEVA